MDGSDRTALVQDGLGLPNALTFDPQSRQLCWADAGQLHVYSTTSVMNHVWLFGYRFLYNNVTDESFTGTRKVECVDPFSRLRRKLTEGIQYPFAIVSYGRNLYYTDWRRYVTFGFTLESSDSQTNDSSESVLLMIQKNQIESV